MTNLTQGQVNQVNKIVETAVAALKKDIATLINQLKEKSDRLNIVEKENKELRDKVDGLKTGGDSSAFFNKWVSVVKSGPQTKPVDQHTVLNAVTKEQSEQRKREKNLIIFGVKTSKIDHSEAAEENESIVTGILTATGNSAVKPAYIRRLRAKEEGNACPIVVEFKSALDRNTVLKSARTLKGKEGYGHIYINPDLTESERVMDRQLRSKRNELNDKLEPSSTFHYGIRNYSVVKITNK